jgi:methylphosphotriester-DNA--protein-cysteine methyltransferase
LQENAVSRRKKVSASRAGANVHELKTRADEAHQRRQAAKEQAKQAKEQAKLARRLFKDAKKIAKRAKAELDRLSRKLKKLLGSAPPVAALAVEGPRKSQKKAAARKRAVR